MRASLRVVLVASVMLIVCGGLRAQNPAPQDPPKTEQTQPATPGTTESAPTPPAAATGRPARANAPKPAEVKRDGGRVWIENVPVLGWGKSKECTFAGALEAATAVTVHPLRYGQIMAASGLAFRTRWSRSEGQRQWSADAPRGEFPAEIEAVSKATGWGLRVVSHRGDQSPDMARYAADIVASIDAGKPVIGYPGGQDMGVIIGYEDGGKSLLWHDYSKGPQVQVLPIGNSGPLLIFLTEFSRPQGRRGGLEETLKLAISQWRVETGPGDAKEFWYGQAALKQWSADLGEAEKLTEPERERLFTVSWWCYMSLVDARRTAAGFLKLSSRAVSEQVAKALQAAGDLYQKEFLLLSESFTKQNAFLGPWTGKTIGDWSIQVRQKEQELLTQAAEMEAAAIAELEKAAAALQAPAKDAAAAR